MPPGASLTEQWPRPPAERATVRRPARGRNAAGPVSVLWDVMTRSAPTLSDRSTPLAATLVLALLAPACGSADTIPPDLGSVVLPEGFELAYWAEDVPGARSLTVAPDGTVIVGTRDPGKVHALADVDGDGRAEQRWLVAEGLDSPNGVALRGSDLYVAEIGRILRFPDLLERLDDPPEPEVVTDAYPDDAAHGWKFIRFAPDGRLFVPVGAPCNVCLEPDPYATLTALDVDTAEYEVYARGIRNTVGFDWHPESGELWFTENGRDWMGDDAPPDELNHAPRARMHFGFPFVHGTDVEDPDYGDHRSRPPTATPPEVELQAHVAALGMRFYRGDHFPDAYRGQILYAEHGSWNRSEPVGYRVALIRFVDGEPQAPEPFATGFLQGDDAWGRPVDVAELPDGSLLVSDDRNGAVYRVTYTGP